VFGGDPWGKGISFLLADQFLQSHREVFKAGFANHLPAVDTVDALHASGLRWDSEFPTAPAFANGLVMRVFNDG
jgi:hypothetical protein